MNGKQKDIIDQIIQEVEEPLVDIGIPKRLSDIGVALDDIAGVVNQACDSFLNPVNPRPATQQDLK